TTERTSTRRAKELQDLIKKAESESRKSRSRYPDSHQQSLAIIQRYTDELSNLQYSMNQKLFMEDFKRMDEVRVLLIELLRNGHKTVAACGGFLFDIAGSLDAIGVFDEFGNLVAGGGVSGENGIVNGSPAMMGSPLANGAGFNGSPRALGSSVDSKPLPPVMNINTGSNGSRDGNSFGLNDHQIPSASLSNLSISNFLEGSVFGGSAAGRKASFRSLPRSAGRNGFLGGSNNGYGGNYGNESTAPGVNRSQTLTKSGSAADVSKMGGVNGVGGGANSGHGTLGGRSSLDSLVDAAKNAMTVLQVSQHQASGTSKSKSGQKGSEKNVGVGGGALSLDRNVRSNTGSAAAANTTGPVAGASSSVFIAQRSTSLSIAATLAEGGVSVKKKKSGQQQ
ncbi:hypothetical protein HDU76_009650, partial [Blyttiomyces sp. JEL0837]